MSRKTDQDLAESMRVNGAIRLQEIHHAAYGIQAIAQLVRKASADDFPTEPDYPMNGYVIGGLLAAAEALTTLIQDDAHTVLEWTGHNEFSRVPMDETEEPNA
jgi:hypothetical protein